LLAGELLEPEKPPVEEGDVDSLPSIASPRLWKEPPRFTLLVRSVSARLEEGLERLEELEPQSERFEEGLRLLPPEKMGFDDLLPPEKDLPKPPPRPPLASESRAGRMSRKVKVKIAK
jgi:hypothetical protein